MKITNILHEDAILVNMPGSNKEEIINAIVDLAGKSDKIKDLDKVRQAIFDRERIMSTGVGKGFAIPHGKCEAITDVVAAFATTEESIDYESLDNEPVRLVFLLIGKDRLVASHIKYLSRISRLMNKDDFRAKLLQATSPKEIFSIFEEEEKLMGE